MKSKQMMVMGLVALCAVVLAGEASARGGNGNMNGQGAPNSSATCTQTGAAGAVTRPVGSQRRDGTFLTTGVTANGSTTRPGNGRGLQDGSRLTTTVPPAATVAP